ncbi:immunoglobulin I-set domain protein [Streptomyces spongiae]|uniref:Immunoglobulin I-set domain protein n=1 Tax=Streptomyces spongiae TaxID=565072 RepID=A0A5N8XI88_9ACTN|nr:immunoglobulin I-set domain protein [Streptomyces spongiae]MPY59193.1 immunoglobulin I-set domain protein [Streptomyces spongiae]
MAVDTPARYRPGRAATSRTGRRRPAALLGAAALVLASVAVGSAAQAADTPRTALGKDGQKLTVSASANLDPDGETLRVTGEGYDATKGIYVALCKDNGDNRIPTPCLGGADQTGSGSSSKWIVPKGDPNEGELATPYGDGGTFDVEIDVKARDGGLDCTQVTCSVVTRVDHRAAGDRSQDVRIPVAFEGQDPGDGGDGGDGVDVPAGTVSYVRAADFTAAGKPLDVLVHPDSGKLYVGADNVVDTADVNEQGLYVLDAADGKVRSHISQAPGSNGSLGGRKVPQIIAPLSGDGVVFHYPLRGIGTAKDGDAVAKGVWLANPAAVTAAGPGTDASTVIVQQGAALSEIETATGTVGRTLTLDDGTRLGVDTAHKAAWTGFAGGRLSRVDTGSLTVTATAELPSENLWFITPDPASGNVWVGSGNSVLVYDDDAKLLKTIKGDDRAVDVAFDTATGRAFVVWQDSGDTGNGGDNNGSLGVYDTTTCAQAAESAKLPGNQGQIGQAAVAVTPGGTTVYVASPAEGKVTKLDRRMSPKVTQTPTDQTVDPGDEVTFVAAAEGAPEPTVRWQVSTDGGQTWSAIEGATKNAYSFTAKAAHDGREYRAAFTNSAGTTRTTPVTLTVTESGDDGGGDDGGGDGGEDSEPSGTKTVTGPEGQKLTVTPVNNLATEGQTLKVTGSGYDEDKGIYVALCVDKGDGELPTPCIGGVDMTGTSHSSAWISSNPPDYGEQLAIPYGDGGTFEAELTMDAKDDFTDCFKATCVLATRADHTLSGDRSQDVKVPVSFVGQDPVDTDDGSGDTGGGDTGGTTGGSGSTSGSGSASDPTTTGGSLATTGVTVLTLASVAALLTAAGWFAYWRGRAGAAEKA